MRKLRWNWPAWAGFLLSILAFVSYFTVLVRFPITRDVPWVNFLLFGAAAPFFLTGLKRAFTGGSLGGKFASSVLTLLGISILGVFCFIVFRATRQLPASHGAPTVGAKPRTSLCAIRTATWFSFRTSILVTGAGEFRHRYSRGALDFLSWVLVTVLQLRVTGY